MKYLKKAQEERAGNSINQNSPSLLDEARADASVSRGSSATPRVDSKLEALYSVRANTKLTSFGYDQLKAASDGTTSFQGRVADDYILGIGDELVISLRGQTNRSFRVKVDREGKIVLPDLPPLTAAGQNFGAFQEAIKRQAEESFINTEVFVSLGSLRQVKVMVVGDVYKPGQQLVTSLSTVLEALQKAGGVKETGSLRNIQLIRAGQATPIDLYSVFMANKATADLYVKEGDRIQVPAIGKTIAVAEDVNRPGIYELQSGATQESLSEVVKLAGGSLRSKGNRYQIISRDVKGLDHVHEVTNAEGVVIQEGDLLRVIPSNIKTVGNVRLVGKVNVPGMRSLSQHPSLRVLLRDRTTFARNPYTLFGVVERVNPTNLISQHLAVNIEDVLTGRTDLQLKPDDTVVILGLDDVDYLTSREVQAVLAGKSFKYQQAHGVTSDETQEKRRQAPRLKCKALTELESVVQGSRAARYTAALRTSFEGDSHVIQAEPRCQPIYEQYPKLLPFVLDHVVGIQGEVNRPGVYPITAQTSMKSTLAIAGNASREADAGRVELSRLATVPGNKTRIMRSYLSLHGDHMLQPGDDIRVYAVYTDREVGPVLVQGEVKNPGTYDIKRGEKLSELLLRAGGFTQNAYPYGAIFTRDRVKKVEKESYDRMLNQLQSSLAVEAVKNSRRTGNSSVAAIQNLIGELKKVQPLGRVVCEADYAILQVKPELDTILEPNDRIFIPKRPNYVTVTGEVLNPTTLQFVSCQKAKAYIMRAGGYQRHADKGRTFIIYPNGESRPLSSSSWNYAPKMIPPGSAIVVPKDIGSLSFLEFARDVVPVLSNMAMTAASIAVISRSQN